MWGRPPRIEVSHLNRSYRSPVETVWAARDIALTVHSGEFVCIHGASGSGKTTLLHLLAGLEERDSGHIRIGQQDLDKLDDEGRARVRREVIGVVFQDHQLIEEFSAVENVALPLELRGVPSREARGLADQQLERVGLRGLGDRFPSQLSGGQRQRVGIARALVGDRDILLADEPTGSLDSAASLGIFELIQTLCDHGLAAIVCTHDPRCGKYAGRVFQMIDGALSATKETASVGDVHA